MCEKHTGPDYNDGAGALCGFLMGLTVLAACVHVFELGPLMGALLGMLALGIVGAAVTAALDARDDG